MKQRVAYVNQDIELEGQHAGTVMNDAVCRSARESRGERVEVYFSEWNGKYVECFRLYDH